MTLAQPGLKSISPATKLICLFAVVLSLGLANAQQTQQPTSSGTSTSTPDSKPQDRVAQAAQQLVAARGIRNDDKDILHLFESIESPSETVRAAQNSWIRALKQSTGDDPTHGDVFPLLLKMRQLTESEHIRLGIALAFEAGIKKLPKSITEDWKAVVEKAAGETVSRSSAATSVVQYEALFEKNVLNPQKLQQYVSRVRSLPEDARDQWAKVAGLTTRFF